MLFRASDENSRFHVARSDDGNCDAGQYAGAKWPLYTPQPHGSLILLYLSYNAHPSSTPQYLILDKYLRMYIYIYGTDLADLYMYIYTGVFI